MTARERAAKLTDEERRKQFRLEWAQRVPEPTKKGAAVESEPTKQPRASSKSEMTIAQKKAIRDEQQKRWLASAPGRKAAKKAKE